MTNKNEMPVVGKRYRGKTQPTYSVVANNGVTIVMRTEEGHDFIIPINSFDKYFEEFPDQPQIDDEVKFSGIKEALKQLKYHVGITKYFDKEAALADIKEAARNLIDALEGNGNKQVETKKEAREESRKGAVGKEWSSILKQEKSKSLWKDVSEEPESVRCSVIIKHRWSEEFSYAEYNAFENDRFIGFGGGAFVQQNISHYCLLTDFINSFEQLQRDVEEIKGKIK